MWLRVKWGDTHRYTIEECRAHLTVHDTVSDLLLKVDLRILYDKVRQRYNVETDLGVLEAAEENSGDIKYINDRCKVMIESKAVIDKFVLDGCLIDSVDSLQVCGLEIHFGNTTLAEPGPYVGTQFNSFNIDKSLSDMTKYFDLVLCLLYFRDQCVAIANQYEDHLIKSRSQKISSKRQADTLPDDDIIMKQNSVGGSWNPPRTLKTIPPP